VESVATTRAAATGKPIALLDRISCAAPIAAAVGAGSTAEIICAGCRICVGCCIAATIGAGRIAAITSIAGSPAPAHAPGPFTGKLCSAFFAVTPSRVFDPFAAVAVTNSLCVALSCAVETVASFCAGGCMYAAANAVRPLAIAPFGLVSVASAAFPRKLLA
jgi:hypothetical protein